MSDIEKEIVTWTSLLAEETEQLGMELGKLLRSGDLVCLSGDLGAGKTVMSRGIGRGWGTFVRVTSPTFTLVNEYPRHDDSLILYHLDCYRLSGVAEIADEFELESTGLPDMLISEHVVLIEWAERVEPYLAAERLWIRLEYKAEAVRQLTFTATGARPIAILRELQGKISN